MEPIRDNIWFSFDFVLITSIPACHFVLLFREEHIFGSVPLLVFFGIWLLRANSTAPEWTPFVVKLTIINDIRRRPVCEIFGKNFITYFLSTFLRSLHFYFWVKFQYFWHRVWRSRNWQWDIHVHCKRKRKDLCKGKGGCDWIWFFKFLKFFYIFYSTYYESIIICKREFMFTAGTKFQRQ